MAILPINAGRPHAPGLLPLAARLESDAPIIVMIHGYRYCPFRPEHDPHRHILGLDPHLPGARRLRSWPRALGFTADGDEGLGIAFGWSARGSLASAYRKAGHVGAELGRLIAEISQRAGRPVHLIGHSLGARVALQAVAATQPGSVGRLILMSAAELQPEAETAMDSPAGHKAEVINVTSRENDPFDLGLELLVARARSRALGLGLSAPRRNWLDLQIDGAEMRAGLAALGFDIGDEASRACHWSPYLREGLFDFYRVALAQPWALPLPLLRAHLPTGQSRRWSRLLQPPKRLQSFSFSNA
ncbi:alpha/beta fold hydrolase [Paracoccus albus]|uniref:alpha/beta fold hydrolase n=1 Tax=Paracoccus albus TaxID=3017784 RepID=UPI0022F025EA|nr:alpha/beta fold hydrolase [Paracoccus albus]WBU60741.1 alpha/beta fold hydrolase [Paracoccus albus]